MNLEKIKRDLSLLKKARNQIKSDVRDYCQNKNNDLDERWELFIESGLGDCESYCMDFDCRIGKDVLDNAEQRGITICVDDALEFWDDEDYTEEEIEEYKENVLKSFIKEFIFDW